MPSKRKATPEPPPKPQDSTGGEGGDRPKRADLATLRLERMAIAQAWPVKLEDKEQSLENVRAIQRNKKAGDRSHIAAARTLVTMTGQNLAAIDTAIRAKQSDELAGEVEQLRQEVELLKGGHQP